MIEAVSFALGAGFSFLVYYLSIRPLPVPATRKVLYFLVSFIGITGMLFLFGIMASFMINGMQ